MYKIIFFDLDGTLLNEKKEVLEESKRAIEKARENGIEVAICSGRQKNSIERYKQIAGTGRYIICTNGTEIYDCETKKEIFECDMDKDIGKWICQVSSEKGYFLRIDTKLARYISDMKYHIKDELPMEKDMENFIQNNPILQISVATKEEKDVDEIVEQLKENSLVKVENKYYVKYSTGDLWFINIINKKASKGNAISKLCKHLKIDLSEATAFGDDLNDISMMNTVGYGIAMGNAGEEIKKVAKEIIGTNTEPSIAKTLNRIIEEQATNKK